MNARRARPPTRVDAIVSVEYQLLIFGRRDGVLERTPGSLCYQIDGGGVDFKYFHARPRLAGHRILEGSPIAAWIAALIAVAPPLDDDDKNG